MKTFPIFEEISMVTNFSKVSVLAFYKGCNQNKSILKIKSKLPLLE